MGGKAPAAADSPWGGKPLAAADRTRFEQAFGGEFGHVRVHDDAQAAGQARAMGALAFTRGHEIFFAAGQYAPGTPAGDRLLAHELTHVLQESGGAASDRVSDPGEAAEVEAYDLEDEILARLDDSTFLGAPILPRATASGIYRTEAPAEPAPAPEEPSEELGAPPDDGEAPPDDPLEALAKEVREAKKADASTVLAHVVAYDPMNAGLARLDEEDLFDGLLELLGAEVWIGEDRAPLVTALAARAPAENVETIQQQVSKGLLELDFRVSHDEARVIYEVLKAMPAGERAAFLRTPEGQEAFAEIEARGSYELRVSTEFGFYDANVEALLAELDALETWEDSREDWLNVVFWMLVQSGHADDPRVAEFVRHNWSEHEPFFAEHGFTAGGALALSDLRDTPNPRLIRMTGAAAGVALKDVGGTLGLVFKNLTDRWGKRAHLDDLPVSSLQKMLGGSLFGIQLAEIPGVDGSGTIDFNVNEEEGVVEMELESAAIEAIDYLANGADGAPMTVTAQGGTVRGLRAEARWPSTETLADQQTLSFHLDELMLSATVVSAGTQLVGINNLRLAGLHFDAALGPAIEGDGVRLMQIATDLETELAALTECTMAAISVVSTSLTGPSTVAGKDGDEIVDSAGFLAALQKALAVKLGGEILWTARVDSLTAGTVVLASGQGAERIDVGFDLAFAGGPRALALLEVGRIEREAADRDLTSEERARVEALMAVEGSSDPAAISRTLEGLGLAGDGIKLELHVLESEVTSRIGISGVDTGDAQHDVEDVEGSARITFSFPPGKKEAPEGEPDQATEGEEKTDRPLYTVEIDVPTGTIPAGLDLGVVDLGELRLAGLEGKVTMLESGRLELEGKLASASASGLRYDTLAISCPGGRAEGVTVRGTFQLEAGELPTMESMLSLTIEVPRIDAPSLVLDKPGAWRANAQDAAISGLTINLGSEAEAALLPLIQIREGQIAGLDAAVGTLLVDTEHAITFQGFELGAILETGSYRFSVADLDANQVQLKSGDKTLTIERFDGAVDDGFVDKDGNGSLHVELSSAMTLGAIDAPFSAAHVSLDSLTLPAASVTVQWVVTEAPTHEIAEDGTPAGRSIIGVTLSDLDVPVAHAQGLRVTTEVKGKPVTLTLPPPGLASLYGIRAESLGVTLAEDLLLVDGKVSAEEGRVSGLGSQIGESLAAQLDVWVGKTTFEGLGTDGVRFALADLLVDATGTVTAKNGSLGAFTVEDLGVGSVEVIADDDGVDVIVKSVEVDGVLYDDGNLLVIARHAGAELLVGKQGQGETPPELAGLTLVDGSLTEEEAILGIHAIELGGAYFEIRDVGALGGNADGGDGPSRALFESLAPLVHRISGDARFTVSAPNPSLPSLPVVAEVNDGQVTGSVLAATFAGRLFEHSVDWGGTEIELAALDVHLSLLGVEVGQYVVDWLDHPDPGAPPMIGGVSDIDVNLELRLDELDLPGLGHVQLGKDALFLLGASGSTDASARIRLALVPVDLDLQVMGVNASVRGLEIQESTNVTVEFDGVSPTRVTGNIVSGKIDSATFFGGSAKKEPGPEVK
jgi:hypothetical protein